MTPVRQTSTEILALLFFRGKSHWELVGGYVQMVSKRDTLNNDLRSCPFVVIYMIKL